MVEHLASTGIQSGDDVYPDIGNFAFSGGDAPEGRRGRAIRWLGCSVAAAVTLLGVNTGLRGCGADNQPPPRRDDGCIQSASGEGRDCSHMVAGNTVYEHIARGVEVGPVMVIATVQP